MSTSFLGGNDLGQRLPQHFVFGPSQNPVGTLAPAGDETLPVQCDDRGLDRAMEDLAIPLDEFGYSGSLYIRSMPALPGFRKRNWLLGSAHRRVPRKIEIVALS